MNFKKMTLVLVSVLALFIPSLSADIVTTATKEELINLIQTDGTTVKLEKNLTIDETINITEGQKVVLDLNGHTITFDESSRLNLKKGDLTITGSGTIKRLGTAVSGPVVVYGSTNESDTKYSTLTVEKDVTIEGIWGVFVMQTNSKYAYGVTLNIDGTLKGGDDGGAITVLGNITHTTNAPVINITKNAKLYDDYAAAIYAAGYATWNIDGAYVEGAAALGVKSGVVNVKNSTLKATGEDKVGESWNNGMHPAGAAVQIESNDKYPGSAEITLTDTIVESEKGKSIYHYPPTGADNALKSLVIDGGEFKGDILLVDGDNITIKSGTFSTDVKSCLKNGYYTQAHTDNSRKYYTVSNFRTPDEPETGAYVALYVDEKLVENYTTIKPGTTVTVKPVLSDGFKDYRYYVTKLGEDKIEFEITDGKFVMPDYAIDIYVETFPYIEVTGSVFLVPSVAYAEAEVEIDEAFGKELDIVIYDDKESKLVQNVDLSALGIPEGSTVYLTYDIVLTKYDMNNNTLSYSVKPIYSVEGTNEEGTIDNSAIKGKVYFNLPIPSSTKATHAKVSHYDGEKLIDEKSYEIKTREDGTKYITVETESFSRFELNLYTEEVTTNPSTGDNIVYYLIGLAISALSISAVVVVKKHF